MIECKMNFQKRPTALVVSPSHCFMRIHIFKLKKEAQGILKDWGKEVSLDMEEAIKSLQEENCLEESFRMFKIGEDFYIVGVMVSKDSNSLSEPNMEREINKKHFAILSECIESEIFQDKIYNVRIHE